MSVAALVEWALEGGAYVEPIEIRGDGDGNRSVFARRAIASGERLLAVPRSLMIGASDIADTPLGAAMRPFAGMLHSRYMTLAAWLAGERRSRTPTWAPFVEALPAEIPVWTPERRAALRGTRAGALLEERMRRLEEDHALLVELLGERATPSLNDLDWGLRMTRSRCFEVAATGGHAFVPIADMIDHASKADAAWTYQTEEACFVCVSTRALAEGEEIRHRYGVYDNARWLAGYGFVLENNPDDEATLRFTPGGEPVHVATRVDARFQRAMTTAFDVAGDGSLRTALAVLRDAARRASDELASLAELRTEDPAWARTCATIRASERAILAELERFATRAAELLVHPADERRAIASSIAEDAVGADRLLRELLLATP